MNNLVMTDPQQFIKDAKLKFKVDYRNIYSSISKNWWGSSVDFLVKYPPIDFL